MQICVGCLFICIFAKNLNTNIMSTQKTLWDKLSPENQTKITQNGDKYPVTTEFLISVLKKNYAWTELSLYYAYQLCDIVEVKFDICVIAELFTSHE